MQFSFTDKELILLVNLVEAELARVLFEGETAYAERTKTLLDKLLTSTGIRALIQP